MIEKLLPTPHHSGETIRRSVVKTISYRVVIIILDFACIYIFTGKIRIALGFTIVSNIYTTIAYFLHERIWDKIKWGKNAPEKKQKLDECQEQNRLIFRWKVHENI